MSEHPNSLRNAAHGRLAWLCGGAVALGALLAIIPGVPASLEVASCALLIMLLGAVANNSSR